MVSKSPIIFFSAYLFWSLCEVVIFKPSTNSNHLRLLYTTGRVALGKTQVGADLGLHHPGNPRAWNLVNSYRPYRSTTTLPLQRRYPTEDGGWWSVDTVISSNWLAWVHPSHWPAKSNQGSTTRGGCTQPTWRVHLEYPAWVIGELCDWMTLHDTYYIRPHYQDTES